MNIGYVDYLSLNLYPTTLTVVKTFENLRDFRFTSFVNNLSFLLQAPCFEILPFKTLHQSEAHDKISKRNKKMN